MVDWDRWGAVDYFQGQFTHTLDAKGRLTIPARFRAFLGDSVVVARGAIERNIDVYPLDTWRQMSRDAQALPHSSPVARRFNRMRFGHSIEVSFDAMGRILLPGFLREYAEIDGEALIVGANGMFELWNPTHFAAVTDRDWGAGLDTFEKTSQMGV